MINLNFCKTVDDKLTYYFKLISFLLLYLLYITEEAVDRNV